MFALLLDFQRIPIIRASRRSHIPAPMPIADHTDICFFSFLFLILMRATGLVVIGESIGSGDSRQQTAVGETPNLVMLAMARSRSRGGSEASGTAQWLNASLENRLPSAFAEESNIGSFGRRCVGQHNLAKEAR
jgi:hypothetical protein